MVRGAGARSAVATAAAVLALCGSASGQQISQNEPDGRGTDVFVTLAARECDEYTDIRANLARNDVMESLQDLGEDTLYSSGDQVDPRTEQAGQPDCRPLVGWRFTFGDGYQTRAVSGVWGIAVEGARPGRDVGRDARDGAGARLPGRARPGQTHRRRHDDRADRCAAVPRRPQRTVAAGRRAGRSGPLPGAEIRGQIRLRRAALRDRRPQRRQRRDGPVPLRRAARLLLRLLRDAASGQRHDRDPQAGRGHERHERDVRLRRQRLLQRRRRLRPHRRPGRARQRDLLPRRDAARRRAVDGERDGAAGLGADEGSTARRARAPSRPTSPPAESR